jgi:hypothetical protein
LYKVDFTQGTRVKVAGKPDQDVSSTEVSGNNGTPFAVLYDAGRPYVEYVAPDSEWAKLHAGLMKRFPGQLLNFNGFTRDEKTVLFHVYSDRNPGVYYQYSLLDKKITLVAEYEPWIKPENMAPMQPVEFTAKDGTKLFGFYTAKGTGPSRSWSWPHGGPIGRTTTGATIPTRSSWPAAGTRCCRSTTAARAVAGSISSTMDTRSGAR